MRSAIEILCQEWDCEQRDLQTDIILNCDLEKIINAINQARKEAIGACSEKLKFKIIHEPGFGQLHSYIKVDKQSILNLINELK